jgi:hypothetical protein
MIASAGQFCAGALALGVAVPPLYRLVNGEHAPIPGVNAPAWPVLVVTTVLYELPMGTPLLVAGLLALLSSAVPLYSRDFGRDRLIVTVSSTLVIGTCATLAGLLSAVGRTTITVLEEYPELEVNVVLLIAAAACASVGLVVTLSWHFLHVDDTRPPDR